MTNYPHDPAHPTSQSKRQGLELAIAPTCDDERISFEDEPGDHR